MHHTREDVSDIFVIVVGGCGCILVPSPHAPRFVEFRGVSSMKARFSSSVFRLLLVLLETLASALLCCCCSLPVPRSRDFFRLFFLLLCIKKGFCFLPCCTAMFESGSLPPHHPPSPKVFELTSASTKKGLY